MLEARSPLGLDARFERDGVKLSEASDFSLTQVAGNDKALKKMFGKIPAQVGTVLVQEGRVLLRVAASQFWVLGETVVDSEGVFATPLSSGRTRIQIEGQRAREVLAACAVIDFDATLFKPGHFVMTGIHHTPVLIHCITQNCFHIYALRTFALNVWEWLCDVAEGLPHA